MPNISNALVASGTGLSTAGNGGRKLVRLSNGWLVAGVLTTSGIRFYKSTDNGSTWSIMSSTSSNTGDFSLVARGNVVGFLRGSGSSSSVVQFSQIDVVSDTFLSSPVYVDTSISELGNVSLAINEAGTELHAAWSCRRDSTYTNSFNIRYAKAVINGDGSVTWGSAEQVTTTNNTSINHYMGSLTLGSDGIPLIAIDFRYDGSRTCMALVSKKNLSASNFTNLSTGWYSKVIYEVPYDGTSHAQANPSTLFVPQSINGLANGRLWVAWQGRDLTDRSTHNVRVSYSDDGGVTWATPVKLTSGNLYDQTKPSLTADKTGKVFLVWDARNATTTRTAQKVFNGVWGETTTLMGDGYTNVSALFDNSFSLLMTSPPLVRQSSSGVFFSGNFNVGVSVSPVSGSLGSKETPTITAYTVTPENGSTIAKIVEKLNGVTLNTYNNPASLSRTFTVPQVNWDGITFWYSHTAEIIVTDSNGATTTTTYTFVKGLADDAPLLEGVAATEDAYERISQKRDALAAQVGLSAGATFDAISAQLETGLAFKKFATGTATVSGNAMIVSGLTFKPSYILVNFSGYTGNYTIHDSRINPNTFLTVINSTQTVIRNVSENGGYITAEGFRLMIVSTGVATWIAIQ